MGRGTGEGQFAMATLFLSDLHLCLSRPRITAQFEAFMAGPAGAAEAVYILGDLFEYWAGDDDTEDPFNSEVLAAMRGLAATVPLYFMPGNRDFLTGPGFSAASGATLLADPLIADLYGTRTLIMHGDTLCTDDVDYQRFRAMVRAGDWTEKFLATPLPGRKRQIEALRARSETEKRAKPMAIMDVNQQAVEQALRASDCRRLIHGHTHRPGVHRFLLDGQPAERWVLADWYERGSYLICDASGLREVVINA